MITFFYFIFFFFFLSLISLPLVVIFMIFLSLFSFGSIWVISGSCWFPIIFSLLFIGGILVIFMVVSSLFPNSANFFWKIKKKFFFFFLFLFTILSILFVSFYNSFFIKYSFFSGGNFFSFGFLIFSYFFCFLYFVSKDKMSLRSFF